MSDKFKMLNQKQSKDYCNKCTYYHSCQLLKYLNGIAMKNAVEKYDERFGCTEFDKQPLRLGSE